MTREEAKRVLEFDLDHTYNDESKEALRMAIKALAQEPCEDCISRQAVLEVIKKCHCEEWVKAEIGAPIEALPPVTPAEKTGHWIKDESSSIAYRCTVCNTLQHWSVIQKGRYHYCLNCGAKMKEGD